MNEKRAGRVIIFVAFLVIICFSKVIWFFAGYFLDMGSSENRQMALRPELTLGGYGTYSGDYTAYFNDHLQFRNILVTCNSWIDYYLFDRSASEKVIKGEDGWLFYYETLPDYQGTNIYTVDELESIKNDVLATKKFLNDKGIEFIIFIGPNKNTIYGEYMPSNIKVYSEYSRVKQMVDYLRDNTDVKIIFPVEELLQAKIEHPEIINYFRLDTHWNYMGGFWASESLLKTLGANTIDYNEIDYYQVNEPDFIWHGYDEASMLGLSDILDTDINYRISTPMIETLTYDGYVPEDEEAFNNFSRVYSDAGDNRKVFFARDSFGEAVTPFIASSFSEIYSVHYGAMKRSQIDEERPDIFIYEAVERSEFKGRFNYKNWAE
ncbi:MAG: hypothetical protein K5770_03760 [Lachnospiraceae bacterium]|nr:hypothetical protein [Lachnospiraceae bacterium]